MWLKLRSHPANGRETDKKSFRPFVSGRIRFMSVSNPVNPFLVRWCPFRPVESFEHSTEQNGQRRPFDVRSLSVTIWFVRNSCVTSPVLIR